MWMNLCIISFKHVCFSDPLSTVYTISKMLCGEVFSLLLEVSFGYNNSPTNIKCFMLILHVKRSKLFPIFARARMIHESAEELFMVGDDTWMERNQLSGTYEGI